MTEPSIPSVDLSDLDSAEPERRARAASALREGFGTYGLVYVAGHGVDGQRLSELYDRFGELTARPDAEKQRLNRPDLWFQRGWTPPNTERAVVSTGQPDFKECYFAAPIDTDAECQLQYPQIHAANIWPTDVALEAPYLDVGRELHAAGERLLAGCAESLGLARDAFVSRARGGPHVFRLLRYLPLDVAQIDAGVVWGEEHTDFNLITLLPGGRFHGPDGAACDAPDAGSGLYLRTRPTEEHPQGRKVRGVAPPGHIVAQVGQALEILTGGAFLATPHVITAPKTPGYSRFSAAHFVHLHSHQILFPLPELRSDDAVVAYSPPVLAGTYALKTLVDINLAPPDALTRLGYRHYHRLAQIRSQER